MNLRYDLLLSVDFRHGFYADAASPDLQAQPSPACRQLLRRNGLIFRETNHGFAVYGELDPEATPPELLRAGGDEALRMSFTLRLATPFFLNITDLPQIDLGREVLYFNNLREDQADGRLHLGDSVADDRIGTPVTLVVQKRLTHTLPAAADTVTLSLEDLFGRVYLAETYHYESPVSSVEIDLSAARGIQPGFYRVTDDQAGAQSFYFDPGLYGRGIIGVIDVFSRTDTLAPDETDRVPADYRFLDGAEVLGAAYVLQFEARETTWRYVVGKKYDSSTVELADLSVQGGAFSKATNADAVIFESNAALPLHETGADFDLHSNGTKLLDLPSPDQRTPLQEGTSPGSYASEIYIYV